jgi:ATP-dependent helicase/nuclease subunit A
LQRAAQAAEIYRELPFSYPAQNGWMTGEIDLLFREDDHWILVDYKTDKQPEPERYRQQLQAYVDALHAVAGIRVAEVYLLFLETNEAVKLS